MKQLTETPFFFQNTGTELFGVWHRPGEADSKRCFVFCYPCFEEKLWAQRVFVSFARELARRGYHVLRFDFMGHGDSDGDFYRTNIHSRVSDLTRAVDVLRNELGTDCSVGLLGLRLGATIAAIYAEADPNISKLVLWDPIINGAQYMQEILLANLATQTTVYNKIKFTREALVEQMKSGTPINVDGYELGYEFYDETTQLDLMNKKRYDQSTLIIQIVRSLQKQKKDLESFRASYGRAELHQVVEEPFWKEIKTFYSKADSLFNETLAWLHAHERDPVSSSH